MISESSSGTTDSFHEAQFRFASVVERVDSLYRLATKIRNPRNRPQRPTADLYKHIPEHARAEYRENQERIETALVAYIQQHFLQESVTDSQLDELGITKDDLLERYSRPEHWLVRRIGIANARRKQQFVYWRRHAQILAHDTTAELPITHDEKKASDLGLDVPTELGKSAPSMATSATKILDIQFIGADDLKSDISHHSRVSTVVSPRGLRLAWPPAPQHLAGSKFFPCPYCKVLCPAAYLDRDAWRYVDGCFHLANEPSLCS